MPHINEKYDFVTNAYIVFGDKVLLVHHPRYGKWLPMGGHVELDEDPEQTLLREIKEETGLKVKILAAKPDVSFKETKFIYAPNYIDVHNATPTHRHIALNYFAKANSDQFVISSEHDEIKWFFASELNDPKYSLSESVKFLSKKAIKAAQDA